MRFFLHSVMFSVIVSSSGLSCISVYTNNAERARGATISPREGIGREERAGGSCREKEHEPFTTAAVHCSTAVVLYMWRISNKLPKLCASTWSDRREGCLGEGMKQALL